MSDLNEDDLRLFQAARAGYEPSDAERKRVLRGVLLRAGVAIGATTAATASATSAASVAGAATVSSATGLALKVGIWVALGGFLGVGGYVTLGGLVGRVTGAASNRATQAATAHAPSHPGQVGSLSDAPDLHESRSVPRLANSAFARLPSAASLRSLGPASSAVVAFGSSGSRLNANANANANASASANANANTNTNTNTNTNANANTAEARAVAAFPSRGVPESIPASGNVAGQSLGVEARALARAQSALREGKNEEALRLVDEQKQRFGQGELQPERVALRILALCALGRVAEARAIAREFRGGSSQSPFASRIGASCVGE